MKRQELENVAMKYCKMAMSETVKMKRMVVSIHDKHDINPTRIMDIIADRISIKSVSDFELFCFLEAIKEVYNKDFITESFTEAEIRAFSTMKISKNVVKFPLIIKCVRVRQDQYIGTISVKELMALRGSDMINYNTNTQRAMKERVKKGDVYFQIALNLGAVNKIKESLSSGVFIPNTITLNIPVDSEDTFEYDEKKNELIISSLDAFDITDGYHRYVAMCALYDSDEDFDYPMELRITNFTEEKTKQFIYQEDQKTRMRKVDSDSMNMDDVANVTLERINQDPMFSLGGQILRNGGLINFSDYAEIIRKCVLKKKIPRSQRNKKINELLSDLKWNFNYICEKDSQFLSKRYTKKDLILLTAAFEIADRDANKLDLILENYANIKNAFDVYESSCISSVTFNKAKTAIKEVTNIC